MHLRSTILTALSTLLTTTIIAGAAVAADYYVSPTGSDGNAGTQAAPWKTLQKAANSVSAGDVVHVADGFYVGFQVTRDGTSSSPITFRAEGNNVVVNAPNPSTPDNINVEGGDYVVIDGFIVEDAPRVGIRAVTATGVVIRNNDVRRSGLTGILSGWTPNIQVIDNVSSAALDQHGIYISNSNTPNDNPIIRGNECYGNNKNGIQINGDCWEGGDGIIEGAIIENNFVHDNNWKGLSIISMQNSVIQNNVIYENGLSAGAGGIHLADQVGPSCGLPSNNNVIVNNTVVEPRIACMRFTDGSTSNVVFNNLCVAGDSGRLIADEVGGNLIDGASNITVTSSAGLFENESSRDYHLAGTSAAIDAGVAAYQNESAPATDRDGGSRPAGNAFDVGAYESGASGGNPPPPPSGDTTPPSLVITSPTDGAQVSGSVSVNCTASDDVGVVGVTFYLNGNQLGNEDLAAPFSTTLSAGSYPTGYYQLHCTARDAAGNYATSAVISVFLQSLPGADGIPATHPRLYNITNRIALLRQKACRDDNGNIIPGCTQTADYDDFVADNITSGRGEPWSYAMMYLITQDMSYATEAINRTIAEIDNGLGQKGAGERQDYFLNGHHYVRSASIVYDWLYDLISPSDRAKIINYLNQLLYEIWNPRTNICKYSAGWGQGNPKINYYYRHVMAAALVGIATYGENDYMTTLRDCETNNGSTVQVTFPLRDLEYTDPIEFVYGNIDQLIVPYIDAYEAGGGWHEGTNYGRATKILMLEVFTILRDAGLRNMYEEFDFPRQAVLYHMYEMQPGNREHYTNGDAPRDPRERPNDSDRHLMLLLIDGLPGHIESEYAHYWVNRFYPQMDERKKKAFGFFYYDPGHPERDYRLDLPTSYYAPGMNYVNSRSSWGDDAVSVNFVSTERFVGHCHKNQNEFAIFLNEWQTVSGNTYSVSGLHQETPIHNTITIAGEGQRFGDGTGAIIKYETSPDFTYTVGDASDAYYTSPGGFGEGDQKMIQTFQREFVHLMPNKVVVFDRITPMSSFQSSAVTYNLNSLYQPSVQGNLVTCTNGDGRVFQRTLLPASVNIKTVVSADKSFEWWRAEITPTTPVPNHQFLNVLEAVPSSVSTMQAAQVVNASNNTMVGVEIDDPSEKKVIMFSTHPTGNPPQGDVIYEVGMEIQSLHILLGMVAGARYDVAVVERDGRPAVVVSHGDTYTCSDQGVLSFRLPAAAPVVAGR